MEHLKEHLDNDTSLIIFDLLINGEDYTPFRYEDIVSFCNKITEWDLCIYWAAENGRLDIVNFARLFIGSQNTYVWDKCIHKAVIAGHIDIFNCVYKIHRCDPSQIAISAGESGNISTIDMIDKKFIGVDYFFVQGATKGGYLDIFINYLKRCMNDMNNSEWGNIIENIIHGEHLNMLEYIGTNIDRTVYNVDWTECLKDSIYWGTSSMFKYSLSKGGDVTKLSDYSIGLGGNIEIAELIDSMKNDRHNHFSINWNVCMEGASNAGQLDMIKHAWSKGANNWIACMLISSKTGKLSDLIFIENEAKRRKQYINTAIWNKCMIEAIPRGYIKIIKYCGKRRAYNWNRCMKYSAYYGYLDILKYSESKGADDWKGGLDHINDAFVDDVKWRENLSEIVEYLQCKIKLYDSYQ